MNKAAKTSCVTCGKRKTVKVARFGGRRSSRLSIVPTITQPAGEKTPLIHPGPPSVQTISKPAPSLPWQSDCETESEELQERKEPKQDPINHRTPLPKKAGKTGVSPPYQTSEQLKSCKTKLSSDQRQTTSNRKHPKQQLTPPGSPSSVEWSSLEMFMLRKLIIVCGKNYCQIARILNSKSCRDVWRAVKDIFQTHAMLFQEGRQAPVIPHPIVDDRHTKGKESYELDGVPHNYIPCFHSGQCFEKNCVCIRM